MITEEEAKQMLDEYYGDNKVTPICPEYQLAIRRQISELLLCMLLEPGSSIFCLIEPNGVFRIIPDVAALAVKFH